MLQRPLNPLLISTDFPPCYDRHEKDDPCELCDPSLRVSADGKSECESEEMIGSEEETEKDEFQGEADVLSGGSISDTWH